MLPQKTILSLCKDNKNVAHERFFIKNACLLDIEKQLKSIFTPRKGTEAMVVCLGENASSQL